MLPGMSALVMCGALAAGGSGGGSSGVPNAVSYSDIVSDLGIESTEEETLAGFAGLLPLRMQFGTVSSVGDVTSRAYAVVDGASVGGDPITTSGMVDFNVMPGAVLAFSFVARISEVDGYSETWGLSTTVSLLYKSAGSPTFDTTLDTFNIALGPNAP